MLNAKANIMVLVQCSYGHEINFISALDMKGINKTSEKQHTIVERQQDQNIYRKRWAQRCKVFKD